MYSNIKCKIIFIFIECAEQISTIAFESLIGYDWGKNENSAMSTFILDDYLLYLSIHRRKKNSYKIDNGSQLIVDNYSIEIEPCSVLTLL